jgi:hypothetical protein
MKNEKMSDSDLVNIIQKHVDTGIGSESGELSNKRQVILDRYLGELYGNEKEGQSKVLTREVMETVEWALPAVIRVFTSSSRFVEFQPEGPEDELAAEQETDACNYIYNKDNNGFTTTYIIAKAALMFPNSYVKTYRDEIKEVETENYSNVSDQELVQLTNDSEMEIIGADISDNGLYDLEVKRTSQRNKILVEPLPEDEVVIDSNWAKLDLTGCPFICHYPEKTHSDLLEMGYDGDQLDTAWAAETDSAEDNNRKTYAEQTEYNETHKALRKYRYHECFMLVDFDGDGIAERRRVVMIGNQIFDNEPTDEQPIDSAAAILMPHSHIGLSYAQTIMDLQDVKTTVMRQLMTNMYRANNPRTMIKKGANMSDVLANRANGVIRIKSDGDVQSEPVAPIIGQVLPLLDLLDQQKEMRSGVTRNGMGLDANILAKSTEGAFLGALEKADQRIEMLVRTLAETVFKSIFLKIHALAIKGGDTKFIKTSGEWQEVNPSEWKRRESMTVKVGLGNGDTKQRLMAANIIIQDQAALVAGGAMDTLVDAQRLYNSRKLLVEAAGEANVDKYYMNPSQAEPQQQQPPTPDANMMMIQSNERIEMGKRQGEQAKLQQDTQYKQATLQIDERQRQADSQYNMAQDRLKQEIEGLKAKISMDENKSDAANADLVTQIKGLEVELKDSQADASRAMDKYKADLDAETKLELKRMDREAVEAPIIEAQQQQIDASISQLAQVMANQNAPKEIIFDDNGSPIGVKNLGTGETKSIIKNSEGLPVGIQ